MRQNCPLAHMQEIRRFFEELGKHGTHALIAVLAAGMSSLAVLPIT
jgi:hypothetical protein